MVKSHGHNIVAMMPVRNESNRYLHDVLTHLHKWVDKIIILDDASDDDTYEFVKGFDKVIAYKNEKPLFIEDESALRARLWDLTVKENPDWILAIDADEIFEDRMLDEIHFLVNQDDYEVICFRVFDFWGSKTHYRIDGNWNPWTRFWPFLMRYKPNIDYFYPKNKIHCPRFPNSCNNFIYYYSDIRIKHYGWANEMEHYKKYDFYKKKDLELYGKITSHTQSIITLPKTCYLEQWYETKRLDFLKQG